MSDNTEDDCGCNSTSSKEFNEKEFDKIRDSMEVTRQNLENVQSTIENMNFDFSHLNRLETELEKISNYMYLF